MSLFCRGKVFVTSAFDAWNPSLDLIIFVCFQEQVIRTQYEYYERNIVILTRVILVMSHTLKT